MLTGIHFLLTYRCTFECDHCFVYGSPRAEGTFTLSRVQRVLEESAGIGTVEWVYFEGGEPFLAYPLMLQGIRIARDMGFQVGVVTNAYFATSEEEAQQWLKPLCELGVSDLSISEDSFHSGIDRQNAPDAHHDDVPAGRALRVARAMGMPAGSICIERPTEKTGTDKQRGKGEPIIGGGVKFRGRAVEKLAEGLPRRGWERFKECPYEDLESPERVHVDPYGNVHLCQGLCMGNAWETPLFELVKNYSASLHPICSPLVKGGPALLAREYNMKHDEGYIDACHLCYTVRLALTDKFPRYLAPRQVYGLK